MPVALFCGRVRGNYPDGNRRQPPAAARLRPFGRENGRAFAQRYLYYTIFALIASLFCPFSQLFLKCPRSRVFLAISCGFSAPFPLFFLLPPWSSPLLPSAGMGRKRGLPGRLPAGRGGGGLAALRAAKQGRRPQAGGQARCARPPPPPPPPAPPPTVPEKKPPTAVCEPTGPAAKNTGGHPPPRPAGSRPQPSMKKSPEGLFASRRNRLQIPGAFSRPP